VGGGHDHARIYILIFFGCVLAALAFCANSLEAAIFLLDAGTAIRVREPKRVVSRVSIQIPTLGVFFVLIREGSVRRREPAKARPEVPSAEVVEVRFGVAFFAGEFVVLGAGVEDGTTFAAVGVEVGVVAQRGRRLARGDLGDGAGGAEMVGEIVEGVVGRVAAGDTLAVEEDVLVEGGVGDAAGTVGFVEDVAGGIVPIDFSKDEKKDPPFQKPKTKGWGTPTPTKKDKFKIVSANLGCPTRRLHNPVCSELGADAFI